jgi:hypothetical protein
MNCHLITPDMFLSSIVSDHLPILEVPRTHSDRDDGQGCKARQVRPVRFVDFTELTSPARTLDPLAPPLYIGLQPSYHDLRHDVVLFIHTAADYG